MLKLNMNDLVHILTQIKIAEHHVETGELADAQGNPLNALTPFGLRTVSGQFNNLVNTAAGAADDLMPRHSNPVWNAAEANPRTGAPTSYAQLSGSVYDSQPRIISNLVADQSLTNPVAVMAALSSVGITSGKLYKSVIATADAARIAINDSVSADKAFFEADAAFRAAGSPAFGPKAYALEQAAGARADANAVRDAAVADAAEMLLLAGVEMEDGTILMPNVMTDLGSTAPLNAFMTLFGQFFSHGLDGIEKGGNGTVFVPIQPDDPLYVPGSPTNFFVMTRTSNGPGADGVIGTADDVREATNSITPWIDLSQNYSSHESHQVFLREYKMVDGKPVATGLLLAGPNGGPPTWADVKLQAKEMLGVELSDMDVHRVPLLATDLYGKFIPGANGFAQLVTGPGILVEGNPAAPVAAGSAMDTKHAFLDDIAHAASPKAGQTADADTDVGNAIPLDARGNAATYDNEFLDKHYIAGDGRLNENIGLTAIHHVFHSEHNHRVEQIKAELLAHATVDQLNEWLLDPVTAIPTDLASLSWNGERLFQAGRYTTEQVYQHLVFEEFVRTIQPNIDLFVFSNSVDIDPAVTAEFAHAVYRFGHSQLTETVDRLAADGQTSNDVGLIQAFLNPVEFAASGLTAYEAAGAIIRGMTRQVGNEIDEFVTGALRNNLVGLPLDLAAINIARGRDSGVGSLNSVRADLFAQTGDTQLKPYESWLDYALSIKTPASVINFIAAYGQHQTIINAVTVEEKRDAAIKLVMGGANAPQDRLDFLNSTGAWAGTETGLNLVDFWIGGLAEKKMAFGGLLGTTFGLIFEVQMENLQAGDRFYYISRSQGTNLLNQLEADSWAELAMRNTDLDAADATHLPSSLFLTPAYILELNKSLQSTADPLHDNQVLQATTPMVIRKDTDGDGVDDYMRYTGSDHVVMGGTEFNDTLIGSEGDDTLWGDAGDDTLDGGQGVDHTFGGAGDDVITDGGNPAGAADVIHGDDGNDVINAGEGLDLVFGGRGSDFIFGGRDAKTVTAGEGNDFAQGGDDASIVNGNEGDDWLEGGNGFDLMAGENSELFFNSPIIGHDVMNGRANDTDYDAESGDDIMFQGTGIQRNEGMAGFDWAINKGNPVGADSHMGIPIFTNQPEFTLRDRFDLVEGLSGWKLDDTLTGRDGLEGGVEGVTVAVIGNPVAPFLSVSSALTEESVARIDGFGALVNHLDRVTLSPLSGEAIRVVVRDAADVVSDANGTAIDIRDGAHDIILGGGGNDIIEGDAGNDIIDGDRWLNVRIAIADKNGDPMASAEDMHSQVVDLQGNLMFGGRILSQLMLDRSISPGQMSIVREILDGNQAGDQDTAVFRDVVTNYSFAQNEDGSVTVTHNPLPRGREDDGSDRLFNIEKMSFSDGLGGTVTYGIYDLVPVAATGAPTISNTTPTEGEVLTADLSAIVDPNGVIDPAFRWQSSFDGGVTWTDIAGATAASFTATQAEVGAMVRLEVSWLDLTQTQERLVSAETAAVVELNEAPVITSDGGAASASVSIAENQAAVTTVTATDPNAGTTLAYSIAGGADAGLFQIDASTGALSFNAAPDFESSADTGADNVYDVVVQVSDGALTTNQAVAVTVTDVNEAPVITSDGGAASASVSIAENQAAVTTVTAADGIEAPAITSDSGAASASVSIAENQTAVTTVTAVDPDAGSTLTYSIAGGADAGLFQIDASTGALSFNAAPDFESSADTGADNVYDVVVQVSDGALTTNQAVAVTVTNVDEAGKGSVTLNIAQTVNESGVQGAIIAASSNLVDPDVAGELTLEHHWQTSTDGGSTWIDVLVGVGATLNSWLIAAGTLIRDVVTYIDPFGTKQIASAEVALVGDAGANTFNGTAGADLIHGFDGADKITGGAGDDTLDGGAGNDSLGGGLGDDTLSGGAGNDGLGGGLGDDMLSGGEGNDWIDGGAGADALSGGNGDDSYVVDNAGDTVDESASDGTDRVYASISYTLGTNVENLSLTGSADLDGTGNELANSLSGNAGNNSLAGGAGNDSLGGGLGDDTLSGDDGNDILGGGMGNDTLSGGAGNDWIDGGAGADALSGGNGNDSYVVDNAGDTVDESASNGTDRVSASISYTLGTNVENLSLTGSADLDGTGNELANSMHGNAGNNSLAGGAGNDSLGGGLGDDTLSGDDGNDILGGGSGNDALNGGAGNDWIDGGLGADALSGGNGNDSYVVDNAGDTVDESATNGSDRVSASISYTLGTNVENLSLTGSADLDGTGNELVNSMHGNAGNNSLAGGAGNDSLGGGLGDDTLSGGEGNDILGGGWGADALIGGNGVDTLIGGTGADSFQFGYALAANADRVVDFDVGTDTLVFNAIDYGLDVGDLLAANFTSGSAAVGGSGQFVFNSAARTLSWDADGSGANSAELIATFDTAIALTNADFLLI